MDAPHRQTLPGLVRAHESGITGKEKKRKPRRRKLQKRNGVPSLAHMIYIQLANSLIRKQKELLKASETPEEKRARRLAKKEAKERKKREKMGWDQEYMVHL